MPANRKVTTIRRSRVHESATWCAQRLASGLNTLSGNRPASGFGILMYHRVAEREPGLETPTCNVTPDRFRQQLAGLLSRGFEPWPLRRAIEAHQRRRSIADNVFVVTFDDGYENNLTHALPILQELQIPATIFLATAFLDSDRPLPFDNWSEAGSPRVPAHRWRPLTTQQCDQLLDSGLIELGAHTHTHDAFAGRVDAFRDDLDHSLQVLQEKFGIVHPSFTFPFGLTTPEMIGAAQQAGVACALSTHPKLVDASVDPFHWGRFTASDLDTAGTLAAKLNGWYTPIADVLRKMKRPVSLVVPKATGDLVTLSNPCFESSLAGINSETSPPDMAVQA